MNTTSRLRSLAAVGLSTVVAGAALTIAAAPQASAVAGGTDYTCATPIGNYTVPVTASSDLLPSSVSTGFTVPDKLLPVDLSFTVPSELGDALNGLLGVTAVGGSSADLALSLGETAVPLNNPTAPPVTIVKGVDTVLKASTRTGSFTTPAPGTKAINLPGSFTFRPVNQDGQALPTLSCTITDPADASIGNIQVLKQTSVTTATAAKKTVKTNAQASVKVVVSRQYGAPGAGKVVAKVGSKTVGTGTLKAGKATLKIAKLKKGTAKVVVNYAGDTATSASAASVTLKVVKAGKSGK